MPQYLQIRCFFFFSKTKLPKDPQYLVYDNQLWSDLIEAEIVPYGWHGNCVLSLS